MNSTTQALPPLLDFLQDLMPPSHITLVGAGNGKGRWAQWLSALKVPSTLVEADEQQFVALQHVQAAGGFTQALLLHAVVAAEAGEVEFYSRSLATESGLLSAEAVQQLWPNVHTLQAHQRHATALTELLAQQHANQWLVLDCFPAASLLKAAASALSQLDVVVARVVLTENKAYQIPGAGLAELRGLLPAFTQLALQPTRHPDIAYALFVRDYRHATTQALKAQIAEQESKQAAIQRQKVLQAQLEQERYRNADLLQKQELQAQALKALQADLTQMAQEREAEAKAKQTAQQALTDLQAQLNKSQTEKAELVKKQEVQAQALKALQADLTQMAQERDAEAKAKQTAQQALTDLQAQLNKAQTEKAELLKKQELQAQALKALQADLTQMAQEREAEAKAKQTVQQALTDLQAQLNKAQTEKAELLKKQEVQAQALKALQADLTQMAQEREAEAKAKQTAQQALTDLQAQLNKAQTEKAELLKKQELQAQVQQALEANLISLKQEKQIADDTCSTTVEDLQKVKAEFQKTRQAFANTENLATQRLAQISAFELRISQLQGLSVNQSNRESQLRDALISASTQLKLLKSLFPTEIFQSGKDYFFEMPDFQENSSGYKKNKVDAKQLACIDLGKAWAGNTVNTVIFRHHGILTKDGYQYTAFYIDESTLRVVQRDLKNNDIHTHDVKGQFNLKDAHNSISLGMDRDGCLHMSYDHHATRLRYRRSLNFHDIQSWTDELPMTGVYEDNVTYPTFILPRHEFPLTMLYRDGNHNKGSARIKVYDEKNQSWKDYPTAILSGADHQPWTSNAYWNHPAIGTDGSLHLSFVWRTEMLGEKQLVNNVNVGYAWSHDNGLHWFTSLGQPCKLPMKQVNAETVWPVSPGSNLINQCSMALDSKNRPHIVFYANDVNGVPQYQHLWFDGVQWLCTQISDREKSFNLQGGGTLKIPISRPEIVIDENDHVLVISRGDMTGDALAFSMLEMELGKYQVTISNEILWPEYIEFSEPVIDRVRWGKDKILSFLIQRTSQPDGDRSHELKISDLKILDIKLN